MKISDWITQHELWFLGLAVPLLLFPIGWLPFVGLGLLALTWLCRRLSRGHFTLRTGLELPGLIIVLMALVGYAISVDPALSHSRFWNILLDLAVFYGLANALQPARQLRWIVLGLGAAALGVVLLSLLGTDWDKVRLFELPWLYDRLPTLIRGLPDSGIAMGDSDLINPRWVGVTLGVLVPVLLAFAFAIKGRALRLLSLLAALLSTAVLLLTQTLQGLLGLCAGLFFLLVWRSRWWLLLLVPLLAAMVAGVYGIGPGQVGALLLSQDNPVGIAVVLRLDIWSRALAMLKDMPFTGIGLNTFPLIQWHFYPGYLLGPEPHAHNLLLQTAVDLGLPGLGAFIWFFIAWGVRIWRNAHSRTSPELRLLLAGIAAGVIAYLAHGLIDSMMLGAKPSLLIWGLMGIAAASPGSPEGEQALLADGAAQHPRRLRFLLHLLPVLLLLTACLVGVLLQPVSLVMNLAAIQAHWGLYPAQTGGEPGEAHLALARDLLLQVQAVDPDRLSAYELLGRIDGWRGAPQAAMQGFACRVRLDGAEVMPRYYPPQAWLRQIDGFTPAPDQDWRDLLAVYTHWQSRFPERAETYLELGLLWQCYLDDPAQAERVVAQGIVQGAVPAGLLEFYQAFLAQGDRSFCVDR